MNLSLIYGVDDKIPHTRHWHSFSSWLIADGVSYIEIFLGILIDYYICCMEEVLSWWLDIISELSAVTSLFLIDISWGRCLHIKVILKEIFGQKIRKKHCLLKKIQSTDVKYWVKYGDYSWSWKTNKWMMFPFTNMNF